MSYKSYRARKVRRHMQDNPRPSKLYLGILCTHYRNHKEFFFLKSWKKARSHAFPTKEHRQDYTLTDKSDSRVK